MFNITKFFQCFNKIVYLIFFLTVQQDLFKQTDVDDNGFVNEIEALTNINQAIVWKWTQDINQNPELIKKLRSKEGMCREWYENCVLNQQH